MTVWLQPVTIMNYKPEHHFFQYVIWLHKQIIAGISTNIKRNKLETLVKAGRKITETIPDAPEIDLTKFDDSDYREFITNYLQKNISDLFTTTPELKLDANDLYCELK